MALSEMERLKLRIDGLTTLLSAHATIAQELKLDRVLHRMTQQAIAVTTGEAGTLWFADEQQHLAPVVIIGGGGAREQLAKLRLAPGEGVAGRVCETGQPLLIADVHNHPRWAGRFDSATGFRTNSIICTPLTSRGRRLGAIQIVNKVAGGLFTEDDLDLLNALCGLAATTLDSTLQLQQAQGLTNSMIEVFAAAIDARDPFSHGHSAKVAEHSLTIGKAMGLSAEELDRLRRAALLHDAGKIAIPDSLLRKVVALSPEEEKALRAHTSIGAELLGKIRPTSAMADAVQAARHHHERPDGTGYPDGLMAEQPSLFARIITVADRFVRLTSDKPPHRAIAPQDALAEIDRLGGTELDPACAAAFIEAVLR